MATNGSQNIPTGAVGKILRGQGNGVALALSTSTYPATNAVNTLLYASATDVMSELATGNDGVLITSHTGAPSWLAGGTTGQVLTATTNSPPTWATGVILQTASITLTSAEIKALRATPKELIAAPGSGKMIVVMNITGKLVYGGSNVFVAGAGQTIALYYNNSTTSISTTTLLPNAMITSSSSKLSSITPTQSPINNVATTITENVNVTLWQNGSATEISGNAANDNTIKVIVTYTVITL